MENWAASPTASEENPQDARCRQGVAMIYQELNLALHLSVRENILLGAEPARAGWINRRAAADQARRALEQLGHGGLPLERAAGAFGIAEQQVIEIARALAMAPKILILDEPTSSLTRGDAAKLFAVILRLRQQGVGVIYISHFLEECFQIADRYTVLKDGETVGSGPMAEATLDRLITLMTGREVKDFYPRARHSPGTAGPPGEQRRRPSPRLHPASLELRQGEIFGTGGAGRGGADRVAPRSSSASTAWARAKCAWWGPRLGA